MKQSYILSDHDRRFLIDALCCVSAADSRISRGEFSILINALKAAGLQDSDPELKAIVETRCREIHKAGVQRSTEATIAAVRASHNPELGVLICRLQASMLAVDGRVTEYESEISRLFREAFQRKESDPESTSMNLHTGGPKSAKSMTEAFACPLCKTALNRVVTVPLYGIPVCVQCNSRFVNRRVIAYMIDIIVWVFGGGLFVSVPLSIVLAPYGPELQTFLTVIALEAVFLCKDGWQGKSPGRRLVGLTVVRSDLHDTAGVADSLKRNLVTLIPFAWVVIGFQLRKGFRVGDRWAKTKVIWDQYRLESPFALNSSTATRADS